MPYEVRELAQCASPLLPGVDCCIILTMRGSPRLKRIGPLARLCRTTYAQVNDGFRGGGKPAWVRDSAGDLVHAYQHACAFASDKGLVLILEDDAEFMPGATPADFARVDAFVRSRALDAYTLASMGARQPSASHHVRMYTGRAASLACAQAVIWPRETRQALLRTPGASVPHIDGHFLSTLQTVYVYRKPLVVQRFPATENRNAWCVACTPDAWSRVKDRMLIGMFRGVLALADMEHSLAGWNIIYAYHTVTPYALVFAATMSALALARVASKAPS